MKKVPGNLLLTTRKVYFLPESGIRGHELGWNSVKQAVVQTLRLEEEHEHETIRTNVVILSEDEQSTTYQVLRIRVTGGSGGGDYALADPFADPNLHRRPQQAVAQTTG